MEVTRAEIDAVFDAHGRFVFTPNAVTTDGQRNIACDLQPGETLQAFLERHVPGIHSGAWRVSIGGAMVPSTMWAKTYPKHGMLIACRASVGEQVLSLVAMAALTYFTFGIAGAGGVIAATFGKAVAFGVFMAGSILINKVLAPKVPKQGEVAAVRQVYSLSGQRNSARAYEALPVLWGEMRVLPDLASQPYAWYESDEQYMSTILLGGVNVHSAHDLSIGDTPIGSYNDVDVFYNGFAGMPSDTVPLFSNMDSLAGGELPETQEWVTRTSPVDAVSLFLDFEYMLFAQGNQGLKRAFCTVEAQYRAVGTGPWLNFFEPRRFNNNTQETRRGSFSKKVAQGQYEVRVRRIATTTPDKSTRKVTLISIRAAQPDKTDYSQWGRIAVRIKATGQISGSLDTLRVTYRAKPMPIWNGTAWVTATTRANGLCNPGAVILQTLRGIKDSKGKLQFGFGLADEQIDIEGLKSFMLYCTANGYTYDRWLTGQVSLGEFCEEVALAGMGQFSWTDGSRPTVVFVSGGQSHSAVVNMANMLKASFSVDYAMGNAADGIEYQYVDRAKNFETQTLRVMAPGKTTMLSPARVTGDGVTTEAHAAILARYHLAQSLYQFKTIGYTADIEHLDYRRLSLLSLSHDLTQWGFGGRLMHAQVLAGGQIRVQLDEPVPFLATPHLGLRIPGERSYRVWKVVPFEGESDTLTLIGQWPAGVAVPGAGADNPAHDTLWCYDFKATPGYNVRVVSMEPEADLKGARITCVPEGPEFWDYVLNGTYVPAPSQSALPQLERPSVSNLRVTEQANMQGNTQWWELNAVWDVQGASSHCQVWAGIDGSELKLVDARAVGNRSSFRIEEPGEWLVQVRPFDDAGRAGDAATVLYITAGVDVPPPNASQFWVQELAGGLRRFAWSFAADMPAAYAGVQIRYAMGDVPLDVSDWDDLTPLGEAEDTYTAQFETTRPVAGVWTFALRVINTAGVLSSTLRRFAIDLGSSFEEVQQPDLTPPPVPAGVQVSTALANILLEWDQPSYFTGHGHQFTRIYAAQVTTAEPDPARSAAQVVQESLGPVTAIARELGTSWRLWLVNVSNDGVESVDAGPFNATVGKIGNNDLSALIVEAGNLANNAVTAEKVAAGALDATKFAQGIEPVTIVTAPELPTVKSTTNISWQGALYTWDAELGKYKSSELGDISFEDIGGQVVADQIAQGVLDASKFVEGLEPVTVISSGALPVVRQTAAIVYGGKLYRWNGTAYTAAVAATDMTGQVTATQISDSAVTTPKLAANAVEAGKIAANAVTADTIAANAITAAKIAAGAVSADAIASKSITASKLVITGTDSVNTDPFFEDATYWASPLLAIKTVVGAPFGPRVLFADTLVGNFTPANGMFPIDPTKTYRFDIAIKGAAATTTRSFGIARFFNAAGATLAGTGLGWPGRDNGSGNHYWPAISTQTPTEWTKYTLTVGPEGAATFPEGTAHCCLGGYMSYGSGTPVETQFNVLRITEMARGELIVDGAITADKIAASAVTADKIQAGSITASKLVLTDTSNAFPDFDMVDVAAYTGPGGRAVASAAYGSRYVWRMTAAQAAGGNAVARAFGNEGFQVEPNSRYVVTMQMTLQNAGATTARTYFRVGNKVGDDATIWGSDTLGITTSVVDTAYKSFAIETGANSRLSLAFRLDAGAAGNAYFGSITIRKAASAELIVDGAITALKLAANAVTADSIAANAITAAKIAAGAVNAEQIAAGAITASKLFITDRSNMLRDTEFSDMLYWQTRDCVTSSDAAAVAALNSPVVMANVAGTVVRDTQCYERAGYYSRVEPGKTYSASMTMLIKAGWNGRARVHLQGFGPNGTSAAGVAVQQYGIDYRATPAAADTVVTLTVSLEASADVAFMRFGFFPVYTSAPAAGLFFARPRMWMKQDAELIVDGAITAAKIAANAIAVGTAAIQDGAIVNAMIGNLSADKITAGVLAAARIAAGSIDAGKLAASAVTADKLAANAVTADKIAVNAITADKITTNAVTTAKIAAGAVTATEIATNAVTAAKINVTSLSAIAANLGTVTAGRIQNAANTAFWNLGASGSTRMLQLGNDMTYDEVNGLQINKLNVIGSLQLAGNAVTQVTSVNVGSLVMFVSETRAVSSTEIDSNYATYVYIEGESHIRDAVGTIGDESIFTENEVAAPSAAAGWAYVSATVGGLQYRGIGFLQLPEAFQRGGIGGMRWAPRKFTSNVVAIPPGATNVTIRFTPLSREYPSGDPRAVHGIRVHVLQLKR